MKIAHTPPPWDHNDNGLILGNLDNYEGAAPIICDVKDYDDMGNALNETAKANAALIVRAVNSHDALVEALEAVHKLISEGAKHGFNNPEWAMKLYNSQQKTAPALKLAKGE